MVNYIALTKRIREFDSLRGYMKEEVKKYWEEILKDLKGLIIDPKILELYQADPVQIIKNEKTI